MTDDIRRLADAVLYEGHVLWPYRRSALKNRQRWTFGGVYPAAYALETSDRSAVQVECLVEGASPALDVELRFLQAVHRQAARGPALEPVDEHAGYLTWDEASERTFTLPEVRPGAPAVQSIAIDGGREVESLDGGALVRTWEPLTGRLEASLETPARSEAWGKVSQASERGSGVQRVRVRVVNDSPWEGTERDGAIRRTFLSAHLVLRARDGELVSAVDPPDALREAVSTLRSDGLWPVLVGDEGDRHTVLAAPIILSDYARVAPESPGDFFDGGEIDQLLVLNILGLADDEKRELRAGDPRARELLERTEAMTPDELMRLSGAIRELRVPEPR